MLGYVFFISVHGCGVSNLSCWYVIMKEVKQGRPIQLIPQHRLVPETHSTPLPSATQRQVVVGGTWLDAALS